MSFKFNPETARLEVIHKPSINPEVELLADQSAFTLKKVVKEERLMIFENQVLSVRPFNKTNPKEITFVIPVPAGTTLKIIQL